MKDSEGFEGVWRTIRGARIFIRTGEDLDSAMKRHKEKQEKGLWTTNTGEKVRSYELVGEESGDVGIEFSNLRDMYEYAEEIKKMDRKEYGYSDTYSVSINTDKNQYIGHKITKYRGRYKLK